MVAAAPANAALTLTSVGTFVNPIYATSPPGDGTRLFVVLRDGDIRLIKNGTTLSQPFLSIPDVDSLGGPGNEQGLLSMVFAPDYGTSGRFYVYMVADDANPGSAPHGPIEIREYRRSTVNPDLADLSTKRLVLSIPHTQFSNHYGGTLQFGPDGLMYAGTGDGGAGGDPGENAENTSSRLGKILRLNPLPSGGQQFTVPPGNPFASGVGGDPLVYAYGLRNPFRFSFDRLTGDLTIGDVGQNAFEEIDFASSASGRGRGAYFGWNSCEGFSAYPNVGDPCGAAGDVLPAFVYPHGSGCNSITGGVVVRDAALPSLAGRYIYAELCQGGGYIHSICLPSGTQDTDSGLGTVSQVVGFGETANGGVIVVQLSGQVSRLSGSLDVAACPAPPGGGGPGGGGPGGGGALPPASSPGLTLGVGGALRQRPLRSGNVGVRVRCSAACRARATGVFSLKAKGKRLRLRGVKGQRSTPGTLTLKLKLSRTTRRALRRALRARTRVSATLNVRLRDSAGTLSIRSRTVRLVR